MLVVVLVSVLITTAGMEVVWAQSAPPDITVSGFIYPTGRPEPYAYAGWLAGGPGMPPYIEGFYHLGQDMEANEGDDVYAIADGEIVYVSVGGWGVGNYGLLVKHRLNTGEEFLALYGHVIPNREDLMYTASGYVDPPLSLVAGEAFATIGPYDSLPHLHFGIRPGAEIPSSPWGRMPLDQWPATNGFVDPVDWINTNTPYISEERTIEFSGYEWIVKSSNTPVGPGQNYFSDSNENVWADEEGQLHLKIVERDGTWYCAEVYTTESFGYGEYIFYVASRVDQLDKNVVGGLFTWDDAPEYNHREIDIEFSKWGDENNNNALYTVQSGVLPNPPENCNSFNIELNGDYSTHNFVWQNTGISFQSLHGHYYTPPDSSYIIESWNYFGNDNPIPGNEKVRINLWLIDTNGDDIGDPPSDGQEAEIIIKSFEYVPLSGRSGGPDNFGYTFTDSNTPDGPFYDWIEISGTGTEVLSSSDDRVVDNINIGFFFNFYGTDYSQLAIANNGLLFSAGTTWQYVNDPITQSPGVHGFIAPFWDDIVTWGAGTIYYQTIGTAPNRMFVVEWHNNQHYRSSTSGVTFEAILYEGSNNIKFQYKDVDFGTVFGSTSRDRPPYDNGGSATVGIEGPTGDDGLQYSFNEQVIDPSLAIHFKFPQFAGTNLYLSKQAPASKDRGSIMTYTLHYHNFGDTAAQNVMLEDTLPTEVEFVSASDGGNYDSILGTVRWWIGTVAPLGHDYRTVTVRIPQSVPIGTVIQNDVGISTSNLEVRYDDNEAHAQTSVTGSNLPPDVSVEPNNGGTGTPSIYWHNPITFSYHSSDTATGVDIRIHVNDGGPDITGSMTGGPPDWTYTTTFYPRHGRSTVTYTVSGESCQAATTLPDGLHLPTSEGLIGLEQHLYNAGPTYLYVPPSGEFSAAGLLGSAGRTTYSLNNGYADGGVVNPLGIGAFKPHPSELSLKYYINMRWPDGITWHADGTSTINDLQTYLKYGHKKVLIFAPATGKGVIASIEESGPAPYTGKVAGAPPEVFVSLGLYPRGDGQNEPDIYNLHFYWTDQNAPLGPCTPIVTFDIYIDPAGYIYDADTGERIAGATVWLQRPDGLGGWEHVPTGQTPPITQPDVNPLITGTDGQYQWDVLEGSYRVHVEALGYYPADSIVVSIPPPVTDLHVGLTRIEAPNEPPVANAGLDQTVERCSPEGAEVTLDGSGSFDIDGDTLTYEWTWLGGSASGLSPTVILPMGTTTVTLAVSDGLLSDTDTVEITVEDTTPPVVLIEVPASDAALQDGVTLTADASDLSGVTEVYFYVREPGGVDGTPIGYEDLVATFNTATDKWEYTFDTTLLPDGYYIILAQAVDTYDNEGRSDVVPFSIRNWAVVELLPASERNKAGRTMPVKFALRIVESVDPEQPFVYNEELEIRIYNVADPTTILQSSQYGDTSRDYRIDTVGELYITNFKTRKRPADYVVEIWRPTKDFLVGSFTFDTVK